MSVYIKFSCGSEDRESIEYGPFEYAELTYESLRVDDGHEIAYLTKSGVWEMAQSFDALAHVVLRPEDVSQWWSDIIIYSK